MVAGGLGDFAGGFFEEFVDGSLRQKVEKAN
jgi:hypothetical protein